MALEHQKVDCGVYQVQKPWHGESRHRNTHGAFDWLSEASVARYHYRNGYHFFGEPLCYKSPSSLQVSYLLRKQHGMLLTLAFGVFSIGIVSMLIMENAVLLTNPFLAIGSVFLLSALIVPLIGVIFVDNR